MTSGFGINSFPVKSGNSNFECIARPDQWGRVLTVNKELLYIKSMLLKLILLFTITPLFEFYILIKIGTIIGAGATILIVLFTGIMGGILAQAQGLRVIQQLTSDLRQGVFPADPLWNGLFVLIGAAFLVTPGLITDLLGFLCIIPFTRGPLKKLVKKYSGKKLEQNGVVHFHWDGF